MVRSKITLALGQSPLRTRSPLLPLCHTDLPTALTHPLLLLIHKFAGQTPQMELITSHLLDDDESKDGNERAEGTRSVDLERCPACVPVVVVCTDFRGLILRVYNFLRDLYKLYMIKT